MTTIRMRRDTAAVWTIQDPILAAGEWGIETDTHQGKVGDGTTAWTDLVYSAVPDTRTAVNNLAYTILASDKIVAQTGTLTTSRTFTLPAANAVPAGKEIVVIDESGTVTAANTIVIARSGSDTIDGATSSTITSPYGSRRLVSDGTSKWTHDSSYLRDGLFTAKGSIVAASAANTPVGVTVGSDGYVLKAASGQTPGVQWAGQSEVLIIAVSDETTAITTGAAKVTFRMPFAMTVTSVRANVNTVSSSGPVTVDINEGAGAGTSILSTKITIDQSEFTSLDAVAPVISDTALADDAQITIDIVAAGTGAKGLKVTIIGTRA